jgi:hypothetical protein
MKFAPASRSNGNSLMPCAHFVKFTEEQNVRLHRIRKQRGVSIQAFAHAAVMKAVIEAEKETEAAKPKIAAALRPRGLGIRERLELEEEGRTAAPADAPVAPAAAVTVTVQSAAAPAGADIAAIARMVVDAPPGERRAYAQRACMALAQGRSKEEAMRIAAALDAEVGRLRAVPPTALEKVRARRAK